MSYIGIIYDLKGGEVYIRLESEMQDFSRSKHEDIENRSVTM